MGYLSAEQILGADDLAYEDVEVPEWGGTVRVREMPGTERDKFESHFVGKDGASVRMEGLEGFRARLAAATIVDEHGKQMFRSAAEVKRLGEKNAAALQRVCDAAMRLSKMSEADVKELAGN
ncbi:hypothetical protein [Streptomyces spectabilis]|uniref:Uncharacterized protein n=1 Tax=Streptomyces spectabilis TaxID=68270 RepID=A0A5P2X7X4_STRST|nr:hypothetical protein [Streptomyces spectabilis]MBB5103297.1 hypothetical protein [Streptomyces spectabilis]MCI3902487.1 hypothetical protein [Streptomyces spectabilis]QEV59824.1 hypothetical protein CP982_14635 [Streptomyces spectabilis]GGV13565.1 hypothetical protein GCM10010245_23670 [Streptomyces spectabilis]